MILDTKVTDSASENLSHGKFRVANNSVMQQILSNFLYSDRITAVIREYSINASEAHQVVGCENKPIKVHLPTAIKPKFIVRDFGPGLSKPDLENLFTVYGLSTKRESNDFTGGFGIGSKCGYAYTDSFTVCSYFNGIKYIIVNSKNSRGEFCYNVLGEVQTNEPNGVEIIIDVKNSDINDFLNKAKNIYCWFKVFPETNIVLNLKEDNIEFEESDYKVYGYEKQYYDKNYIVMGQAAYPIDQSLFNKNNYEYIINYVKFNIFLNVNEVSISPSRESLQYNKFTLDKITNVLSKIENSIKKNVEDKLAQCTSLFEARQLIASKFSTGCISKIIKTPLKWKNHTLSIKNCYTTPNHPDEVGLTKTIKGEKVLLKRYTYSSSKMNASCSKDIDAINLTHSNIKFAIYEKGGYEACNRFIVENKNVILYLVQEKDKSILAKDLGFKESVYLYTSDFPKVVRKLRGKIFEDGLIYGYQYNSSSYYYNNPRSFWRNVQIDLSKETGYYCSLKNFFVNNAHPNLLLDISKSNKIIGVLNRSIKRIENNPNWQHIKELCKEKLDTLSKDKNVKRFYNFTFDQSITKFPIDKIAQNSELKKDLILIQEYDKTKSLIDEFILYKNIYEKLGETWQDNFVKTKVTFDIKKYPLLEYISTGYYDKPEVINYINQIESKNE